MKNSQILTFLVLGLSCLQMGWTQDDSPCAMLIQQGIYDKFSEASGSSGYSQFITNFCGQYSQYSNDAGYNNTAGSSSNGTATQSSSSGSLGGGLSIGGFGIFGGGSNANSNGKASYNSVSDAQTLSSSQIASLGQFLCTGTSNTEDANNALQTASEFIDPNAIAAYEQCLTQYAAGLQVTTTVREDQAQVTIEMNYVPPVGTSPSTSVSGIEISPSGSWMCSGSLWNLAHKKKGPTSFGTDSVAMSCERNVSISPFLYQNQSIYAVSSSIVILTTAGAVTRDFSPIFASPPEDAISELTNEILGLNTTLTSEISEANVTLKSFISGEVSQLNATLQDQIVTLREDVAQLTNQIKALQATLNSLQGEFTALGDRLPSPRTCDKPIYWCGFMLNGYFLSEYMTECPKGWKNEGLAFYACY